MQSALAYRAFSTTKDVDVYYVSYVSDDPVVYDKIGLFRHIRFDEIK